ncbi:MAG: hypothetical protein ACLTG4_07595 [Oscillospiraceae bacterium]
MLVIAGCWASAARSSIGGSYRMDWQPVDASTQAQTAAIPAAARLGFPEEVSTISRRRTSPATARAS